MTRKTAEIKKHLQFCCPDFYSGWHEPEEKSRCSDTPAFQELVVGHIDSHAASHDCPATADAQVAKAEILADIIPRIEEYAFHHAVINDIRTTFQRHQQILDGNTLFMVYDFKAYWKISMIELVICDLGPSRHFYVTEIDLHVVVCLGRRHKIEFMHSVTEFMHSVIEALLTLPLGPAEIGPCMSDASASKRRRKGY